MADPSVGNLWRFEYRAGNMLTAVGVQGLSVDEVRVIRSEE
jgi:hypothetical protein